MRRALLALILTFLVVLGGCAGVLGGDQPTPPGVTESGVINATVLADAHENHLRKGYRIEQETTYTSPNGTVLQRTESTTRWTTDERTRTISFASEHVVLGVETGIYSNDTGAWIHVQMASGNTTVRPANGGVWRDLLPGPGGEWEHVYAMAAAPNTTVTVTDDSTTRIRFRDDDYRGGTANGTMTVQADGLIIRYEITYEDTWRGQPVTIHQVQRYSHVGDPAVEEPDWVMNATN